MGKTVYEVITDRILEKLREGTVPWQRPWRSTVGRPRNLVTGAAYRGVNVLMLGSAGFESPYWATFRQVNRLGGSVRKGERSTPVVFWKWIDRAKRDAETGERTTQRIPICRYYRVFNSEQCGGLSHPRLDALSAPAPRTFDPIEAAEKIVSGYPDSPSINHDGRGAAYYRVPTDSIHLPRKESFKSERHYYATLFHEAAHSSGAETRLARPGITNPVRYASHEYSQEELVAEIGAAFLLAEAGIESEGLMENSAAYIASWLKVLKSDPKMVVQAGSQAEKAADHILGRAAATNSACA